MDSQESNLGAIVSLKTSAYRLSRAETKGNGMNLTDFSITFPEGTELDQDKEYCVLESRNGGGDYKIRFHDYAKIYSIAGLYEELFYRKLRCCSPATVCSLLQRTVEEHGLNLKNLCVLELGAGNGMVGEELRNLGVVNICGVDIEENANIAVKRDRPGVYCQYYIKDFTQISKSFRATLKEKSFNSLITVAALGFGDIPPHAFAEAFNLLSTPAWVALNIKEEFLSVDDRSGFSMLVSKMIQDGIMDICAQQKYQHRLSLRGTPLHYIALIGKKNKSIPDSWLF